jgi:hypothetical protein
LIGIAVADRMFTLFNEAILHVQSIFLNARLLSYT